MVVVAGVGGLCVVGLRVVVVRLRCLDVESCRVCVAELSGVEGTLVVWR